MRIVRFVIVCLVAALLTTALLWCGINVLNSLSQYTHGGTGPGGGWSIAMANVLLATLLGLWLVAATVFAQLRPHSRLLETWPVARGHVIGLVAWLGALLAIGFMVIV